MINENAGEMEPIPDYRLDYIRSYFDASGCVEISEERFERELKNIKRRELKTVDVYTEVDEENPYPYIHRIYVTRRVRVVKRYEVYDPFRETYYDGEILVFQPLKYYEYGEYEDGSYTCKHERKSGIWVTLAKTSTTDVLEGYMETLYAPTEEDIKDMMEFIKWNNLHCVVRFY